MALTDREYALAVRRLDLREREIDLLERQVVLDERKAAFLEAQMVEAAEQLGQFRALMDAHDHDHGDTGFPPLGTPVKRGRGRA